MTMTLRDNPDMREMILFCLLLSSIFYNHFILLCFIASFYISSYFSKSYLIFTYLILTDLILIYLILSYLVLIYLILYYLVLSYLILFYLIYSQSFYYFDQNINIIFNISFKVFMRVGSVWFAFTDVHEVVQRGGE